MFYYIVVGGGVEVVNQRDVEKPSQLYPLSTPNRKPDRAQKLRQTAPELNSLERL